MQIDFIFQIIILIMSVVIHEVSHGYVAYSLGDPTAQLSGRLTLNPLRHLDPFGSIILPLLLSLSGLPAFGWAKPVPYNPYNLRAGNWGPGIVAAAGPISNLIVATALALVIRTGFLVSLGAGALQLLSIAIFINIFLAIFNLIPVPPLDGSKVLFALLPYRLRYVEDWLNRYQLILVVLVIFFVAERLAPLAAAIFKLLTGVAIF